MQIYLYPWHFLPQHWSKGKDGLWYLLHDNKSSAKLKDLENRTYDFPPPRYAPRRFLAEEYFVSYVRPQDR